MLKFQTCSDTSAVSAQYPRFPRMGAFPLLCIIYFELQFDRLNLAQEIALEAGPQLQPPAFRSSSNAPA